MTIKNITIAGSGVLGSQIAFQAAFYGYDVCVYDINEDAIQKAKETLNKLSAIYQHDFKASDAKIKHSLDRINLTTDLSKAAQVDLLIEAIPENVKIKMDFYTKLGALAPKKTIFATNSSTMLPSTFAEATGRPDKFLALHFANEIWKHNTAEIMGHAQTDKAVFDAVVDFAKSIGMVALPLHKEQPGYILNSLLVPLLNAATQLWGKEVADPEIIDKTWMLATGAPIGPFGILDVVGLNTVYNINKMALQKHDNPLLQNIIDRLKTEFIDQNKMGVQTGEGFYKYPKPQYKNPDFLASKN